MRDLELVLGPYRAAQRLTWAARTPAFRAEWRYLRCTAMLLESARYSSRTHSPPAFSAMLERFNFLGYPQGDEPEHGLALGEHAKHLSEFGDVFPWPLCAELKLLIYLHAIKKKKAAASIVANGAPCLVCQKFFEVVVGHWPASTRSKDWKVVVLPPDLPFADETLRKVLEKLVQYLRVGCAGPQTYDEGAGMGAEQGDSSDNDEEEGAPRKKRGCVEDCQVDWGESRQVAEATSPLPTPPPES